MATEEKVTYCRVCEPLCGMVATVENGKLVKLRPDQDNPLSKGFACPKGIAMAEIVNDPDRVLRPLRRQADGEFEQVSWDEALDDIGARLKAIVTKHGGSSVGWYMGNPAAFSYSHPIWAKGFMDGLGSPHFYTASSQDVSNRFAASAFLYGSPYIVPIPDLARTQFLLIVGANPLISHGSVMSAPRVKDQLHAIVERGGRVVVVDPRRSETARAFEHVSLHPDADAFLLLSMLEAIFRGSLEDSDAIARGSRGIDALRTLAMAHPAEETEGRTGVAAADVRQLARDLALADTAAVYGRTGSCLGRNGTVVSYLLDALNLVTGNLDREGGAVFGDPPVDFEGIADLIGVATYSKVRSRVGDLPEVLGSLPATVMAKEMTTEGDGRIRAFFVSAGNPVLSVPNGEELVDAMEGLELSVALDFYISDTSRHCDYVLPATTMYEREDFPLPFLSLFTTPFIQMTDAVVEPAGEARQEWQVIEEIAKRIGIVPNSARIGRLAGKLGIRLSPERLVDLIVRGGRKGDLFGLRRGGLSVAKLRKNPHGIVLGKGLSGGVLQGKIRHRDKKVRLDAPEVLADARAMAARNGNDPGFPLRLIGLRELRSHNSWMHNAPLLMRGDRTHTARIHPDDAESAGVEEGQICRVSSAHGAIELPAQLTDEVKPGTVAIPHGWGHTGGWKVANAAGGVNVNALASSDPADLERLAGMAHLNGIPIRLEPVATPSASVADPVGAGVDVH
ncbi:MAG: molybdopterin-dependent oxidoreductase [Solirubrobacterales bacterium]